MTKAIIRHLSSSLNALPKSCELSNQKDELQKENILLAILMFSVPVKVISHIKKDMLLNSQIITLFIFVQNPKLNIFSS